MSLDWILLGLRILATLILYTFLGVAFFIIWRDLKLAATQPQVSHRLRVINPADDKALVAGKVLPIQPVTLLGRDPENTIVLTDTSTSGRHARLSRENGVWWLEDLGSKNGTSLNELPLSRPVSLANGDVIGIGNVQFCLELDNDK